MISRVQVDDSSSINLMNTDTMDALDLVHLIPTILVLWVVDHSHIKSIDILSNIQTIIIGIEYKINYIIF